MFSEIDSQFILSTHYETQILHHLYLSLHTSLQIN
jgi:hypothetical protein